MGMGRNSSRIASRRLANSANKDKDHDHDGGEDEDEDWIEPSKAVGNRRKVRFYKCLVIQCRIIKIPAHFATLSCRETRILPDETVEEATHLVSRAPLLLPRVTPTKTRWTLIQEYRRHHLDTKI